MMLEWDGRCDTAGTSAPIKALARLCDDSYDDDVQWSTAVAGDGLCELARFDQGGTQAFLVERNDGAWRALIFRGTQVSDGGLVERVADVAHNFRLVHFRGARRGIPAIRGRAHAGYRDALADVWPKIHATPMLHQTGSPPLYVAGHSLGGAVATLYAAAAHHPVSGLVTFGAPKAAESGVLSQIECPCYRLAFALDWATAWPPSFYLAHPSERIDLDWPAAWWRLYRHSSDRYAEASATAELI